MTVVKAATQNPAKLEAFRKAFEWYIKDEIIIVPCEANSDVPDQPINDEVFKGAENRLIKLKDNDKNYDYLISCEGGMLYLYGTWVNIQVVIVEDKQKRKGVGLSQAYEIPTKYVLEARKTCVAEVFDRVFEGKGGVRKLTQNHFKRSDLVKDGAIMALAKIMNGEKWE